MALYTFRLPDIGEGIAEAEIVAWHVQPGDMVGEDSPLADMMTDKATVEMESPVAGRVVAIAGEVGERIPIGSMLVEIEVADVGAEASTGPARTEPAEIAPSPVRPEPVEGPGPEVEVAQGASTSAARTDTRQETSKPVRPELVEGRESMRVLASPAVRQRAQELGIDLAQVRPSQDGRVRHGDLDQFLAYNRSYAPAGVARADEQVKVIGLRRRIAENMAASKRAIPHFSYVEECDVTALEELRAQLNAGGLDRPRLTMLPLLIVAICRTLPQFPMLNARYDDEAGVVTRHGAVHLGMATQTPAGLMVPVIRNAQDKNPWALAQEIARLAEAARNGTAKADELSGSTFTITSLGPLGGVATTPVINRPEVAIIGPNRIVERPMFVPDGLGGERLAKRKLMNISISCDHRVVDGWDAASFVQAVKKLIETPALILA
ncbi:MULTISPECIES: dihydrolipoamide acetyltransferase family protein [unclassified Novosphingobium]|uniref:dihydrolipoamide acetyltransferase family protein n=1 Tax=unclassified Novosphingobium TaxID=2644732 RepID=UPI00146A918D|nr:MULTISPECIES: dihydrolipoamide acetyltransferase family protein [unclassified Novosphingobium]NMN06872.1 2-oxoisovalerate dehydrogenase E2 component (dihydrolipoyl transacylase) [Novosphingobium sp. SG919]NMN89541.1 2-oxoisovalerate dehydrogenase E2 component (dihydrolipoyl transacylase) [Novosphingobium sp. SG916]